MAAVSESRTIHVPTFCSRDVDHVVVGNRVLKNLVERALTGLPYNVQLYPRLAFKHDYHYFIRDTQVTRLDGSLLFPFSPLQNSFFKDMYITMLPESSNSWVFSDEKCRGYSTGINQNRVNKAISYAKSRGLKHVRGKTAIEGGNCLVFEGPRGVRTAIVGSHSVILSFLSLEQQGFFLLQMDKINKLAKKIRTPSDESVRRIRNYSLYKKYRLPRDEKIEALSKEKLGQKKYDELVALAQKEFEEQFPGGNEEYLQKLICPVTDGDRTTYKDEARRAEAAMAITKQVIALELKVDKLAVVDQEEFHIDMRMFVGPKGEEVFVHDEFTSREALDRLIFPGTIKGAELATLQNYRKASEERSLKFNKSRTVQQLEAVGLKVVKVPGVFEAPGETSQNFMNGELFGNLFLTNGSCCNPLQRIFANTVNLKAQTPIDVRFLDVDEGTGFMPKFITQYMGATHCLTMLHPSPIMPTSFIQNGHKLKQEFELWELSQLKHLKDLVLSYLDPFATSFCSDPDSYEELTEERFKKSLVKV